MLPPSSVRPLAEKALPLALLFLLVACSNDDVRVYSVPKGSETIAGVNAPERGPAATTTEQPPAAAAQASPADVADRPAWTLPEGWQESTVEVPMRYTTFVAEGPDGDAEIAVTRFPGDVGGTHANVNRWREQIGLSAVSHEELDALLETFENPGFSGYLVHLRGPVRHLIACGIHEPAADRTWFVRLIADEATAEALEAEIFAFARSFGLGDPPPEAEPVDAYESEPAAGYSAGAGGY